MSTYGRYLHILRQDRQMKQKKIALALGVNATYISAIETGRKGPLSEEQEVKLIKLLNLSNDEIKLLRLYAEQTIRTIHLPDGLSPDSYTLASELQQAFSKLSLGQINVIRSVLAMEKPAVKEKGLITQISNGGRYVVKTG